MWGDPKVQRKLITSHKKHPIISGIAETMKEKGYNRSVDEINTRLKYLKCVYNKINRDKESGIIIKPTWRHFKAIDKIIKRPVFGYRQMAYTHQPKESNEYRSNNIHNSVAFNEPASIGENDLVTTDETDRSDEDISGFEKEPNKQISLKRKHCHQGNDLFLKEFQSDPDIKLNNTSHIVTKEEPIDIEEMELLPEQT